VREVCRLVGPQKHLPTIRIHKLKLYGHTSHHNTLAKTIMQGTVEGGRRRGRQLKVWGDNIRE